MLRAKVFFAPQRCTSSLLMTFARHVNRHLIVKEAVYLKYQTMLASKSRNTYWEMIMKRKCKWAALCLAIAALVPTFTTEATANSIQRRKGKRSPSRVTAPVKNSPSTKEAISSHDIGVEIKSTPFGRVVVLTNREKSAITISKIVINDEWEIKSSDLLHSTKSWTSLPVKLKLGDTLRAPVSPYKRAVIYINLDTDKGKFTFKVNK